MLQNVHPIEHLRRHASLVFKDSSEKLEAFCKLLPEPNCKFLNYGITVLNTDAIPNPELILDEIISKSERDRWVQFVCIRALGSLAVLDKLSEEFLVKYWKHIIPYFNIDLEEVMRCISNMRYTIRGCTTLKTVVFADLVKFHHEYGPRIFGNWTWAEFIFDLAGWLMTLNIKLNPEQASDLKAIWDTTEIYPNWRPIVDFHLQN